MYRWISMIISVFGVDRDIDLWVNVLFSIGPFSSPVEIYSHLIINEQISVHDWITVIKPSLNSQTHVNDKHKWLMGIVALPINQLTIIILFINIYYYLFKWIKWWLLFDILWLFWYYLCFFFWFCEVADDITSGKEATWSAGSQFLMKSLLGGRRHKLSTSSSHHVHLFLYNHTLLS